MIAFDGEFLVPGVPDEVMQRFQDVERMARCMPGAALEPASPDGAHPGTVLIAFGPKKIMFKGLLNCRFDIVERTGILEGRGAAAVRSANAAVKATFQIHEEKEPWKQGGPQSRVSIHSEAEFGGILAEFAKAGGAAVCAVLMDEFSRNVAVEFSRDAATHAVDADVPQAGGGGMRSSAPPPAPVAALSARKVLWASLKRFFRNLFVGGAA
jgi:carbon monoxide dehydrogenase subunit G